MQINQIEDYLLKIITQYIDDNEIKTDEEINKESRLIGAKSFLDSIGLVTFIVEVEQAFLEDHSIEIELASEKAMSRTTSPFISIKTLSKFILEEFFE
mgnify:CR=1 FL=1